MNSTVRTISLDELEKAVATLARPERERLMDLLAQLDSAEWDRQIEEDAKSGKLDAQIEDSEDDFRAGRYRAL